MTLLWSARAQRHLLLILDYIARDAPERAMAYGKKIETATRKLARFPAIGRTVPELSSESPPLREILIDDYRLVYRVQKISVEIVTIFHGRRRFPLDIRAA